MAQLKSSTVNGNLTVTGIVNFGNAEVTNWKNIGCGVSGSEKGVYFNDKGKPVAFANKFGSAAWCSASSFAAADHCHDASDINSGILSVTNGGTGKSDLTQVTVGNATCATYDGNGKEISKTYLTSASLNSYAKATCAPGEKTINQNWVENSKSAVNAGSLKYYTCDVNSLFTISGGEATTYICNDNFGVHLCACLCPSELTLNKDIYLLEGAIASGCAEAIAWYWDTSAGTTMYCSASVRDSYGFPKGLNYASKATRDGKVDYKILACHITSDQKCFNCSMKFESATVKILDIHL